jgi:hypothetical protein
MNVLEATSKAVRARAVVAQRLQIEKREFLARIVAADRQLKAILAHYTTKVTTAVEDKAGDTSKLRRINEIVHTETVALRASLRIWLNAAIRDSARMGFKHIGDALLPIFKHNREQVEQEIVVGRALFEAKLSSQKPPAGKLTFGLRRDFARRTTAVAVALTAPKWADATGRIVRNVTKRNLKGLNPSDRIWELSQRTEMDLKRIVANGMGAGDNPRVIARKIKKYVSPEIEDNFKLGVDNGPGIYRSPYKNAYRLAKTEMNRTYVKATVNFAKDKAWLVDGEITLSPNHADYDECDELAAGGPYSPSAAEALIPAHPHCGCTYTPNIDPKYLGEEDPAPADPDVPPEED